MFSFLKSFQTGMLGRAFAVIGSASAVSSEREGSVRARLDQMAERGQLGRYSQH